jgi:hypothetical protein
MKVGIIIVVIIIIYRQACHFRNDLILESLHRLSVIRHVHPNGQTL